MVTLDIHVTYRYDWKNEVIIQKTNTFICYSIKAVIFLRMI